MKRKKARQDYAALEMSGKLDIVQYKYKGHKEIEIARDEIPGRLVLKVVLHAISDGLRLMDIKKKGR